MKTSTAILMMLPCGILILLSVLLPVNYINYAVAFIMFYTAGILFVIAKYILRGDNAHLINGISISYEQAKLPENIEKYAIGYLKNSSITFSLLNKLFITL